MKDKCSFAEKDFADSEVVILEENVFTVTIAGNISNNSPIHLNYCWRQCFMVFIFQTTIVYLYL